MAVVQLVNSLTRITVFFAGAALVRACEHSPLSLRLVVQGWLGLAIAGFMALGVAGVVLFLFAVTSLRIFLATLVRSIGPLLLIVMAHTLKNFLADMR
jgi:hypothetical protein